MLVGSFRIAQSFLDQALHQLRGAAAVGLLGREQRYAVGCGLVVAEQIVGGGAGGVGPLFALLRPFFNISQLLLGFSQSFRGAVSRGGEIIFQGKVGSYLFAVGIV